MYSARNVAASGSEFQRPGEQRHTPAGEGGGVDADRCRKQRVDAIGVADEAFVGAELKLRQVSVDARVGVG